MLTVLAGAALLALPFVMGCSTSPTAPVVGPTALSPDAVPTPEHGRAASPDAAGAPGEPGSIAVGRPVDGSAGGVVVLGRFRVTVPPGAFDGRATITVVVPDPASFSCSLAIDPPQVSPFRVPVVLEIDCRGAGVLGASNLALASWDPELGAWRLLESSRFDGTTSTVQGSLDSFSQYQVVDTRAGW
jgi:hypothetical protein